ncbi:DUF6082 family protein [Streptomyces sp. NPDC056713]|uniref:DUF6082 family protein n=1 Tax=Streptomyces sp. NPDC056713 TaxID=3345921 RepID=UPI00369BD437
MGVECRRARAHQQRKNWALLVKAIDDPSLAAVINTYDPEIPPAKVRQFFFANAWYVNLFHLDQAGVIDQKDLYGRLRDLFQSPVFREYWRASRPNRATLIYSSDEARLGRLADRLLEELEEANTEEWWVAAIRRRPDSSAVNRLTSLARASPLRNSAARLRMSPKGSTSLPSSSRKQASSKDRYPLKIVRRIDPARPPPAAHKKRAAPPLHRRSRMDQPPHPE